MIKEIFVKEEAKRKNFGVTTQSGVNQANGEDSRICVLSAFIKLVKYKFTFILKLLK